MWVVIAVVVIAGICFFRRKKKKKVKVIFSSTTPADAAQEARYQEWEKRAKASDELERKYSDVVTRHNMLVEKIGMAYSVAKQIHGFHSPEMEKVIEFCLEDISLAPQMVQRNREWDALNAPSQGMPQSFDTFKRLAIIYEKRGEYQKAAEVCKQAMDLGILSDGTEGGYPGRYAKLVKLASVKLPKTVADE